MATNSWPAVDEAEAVAAAVAVAADAALRAEHPVGRLPEALAVAAVVPVARPQATKQTSSQEGRRGVRTAPAFSLCGFAASWTDASASTTDAKAR